MFLGKYFIGDSLDSLQWWTMLILRSLVVSISSIVASACSCSGSKPNIGIASDASAQSQPGSVGGVHMVANTTGSQDGSLLEEGGLEGQHVGGDLDHSCSSQSQASGDGEACCCSSSNSSWYSQTLINDN